MTDIVLEGKVSNCRYVWHANTCACAKCKELDRTVYDFETDIPDLPHLNCKCYIEVIDDYNNSNQDKNTNNTERCNCLDDLFTEIEELITDAQSLQNQISVYISYFSSKILNKCYNTYYKAIIESCIDAFEQIIGTMSDFIRNYNDIKDANTIGADKYFHSKANCDGAKRGELGAKVAKGISDLREFTDLFKNVLIKGMTVEESLEDSNGDQEANEYGRKQGQNNSNVESRILVDIYRPNGLPEQY